MSYSNINIQYQIPDIDLDSPEMVDPEVPYADAQTALESLQEFDEYVKGVQDMAALLDKHPSLFYDWQHVNDNIIPLPFMPETPQHVEALVDIWSWRLKFKIEQILILQPNQDEPEDLDNDDDVDYAAN